MYVFFFFLNRVQMSQGEELVVVVLVKSGVGQVNLVVRASNVAWAKLQPGMKGLPVKLGDGLAKLVRGAAVWQSPWVQRQILVKNLVTR